MIKMCQYMYNGLERLQWQGDKTKHSEINGRKGDGIFLRDVVHPLRRVVMSDELQRLDRPFGEIMYDF